MFSFLALWIFINDVADIYVIKQWMHGKANKNTNSNKKENTMPVITLQLYKQIICLFINLKIFITAILHW